jgi:hypothetical protein
MRATGRAQAERTTDVLVRGTRPGVTLSAQAADASLASHVCGLGCGSLGSVAAIERCLKHRGAATIASEPQSCGILASVAAIERCLQRDS